MNKLLKYSIITTFAVMVSILGIGRMPQLVTIFALSLAGVRFFARKIDKDMRTKIIVLFMALFLLHVLLSMFMYSQTVDTKYYGFSYKGDDYMYGDFGKIVGNFWRLGVFPTREELKHFNLTGESMYPHEYQL